MVGYIFGSFNYNIDNVNTTFETAQIGVLSVCFSLSGIISGLCSSFHIMHSFMHHQKPKIDIFIKVFLILGFASIVAVAVLVAFNSESYVWVESH